MRLFERAYSNILSVSKDAPGRLGLKIEWALARFCPSYTSGMMQLSVIAPLSMLISLSATGLRPSKRRHKASQSRLGRFSKVDERLEFDTYMPCADAISVVCWRSWHLGDTYFVNISAQIGAKVNWMATYSQGCGMEECIQPGIDLRVSLELALPMYEHSISAVRRVWRIVVTLKFMRKCCLAAISRELLP